VPVLNARRLRRGLRGNAGILGESRESYARGDKDCEDQQDPESFRLWDPREVSFGRDCLMICVHFMFSSFRFATWECPLYNPADLYEELNQSPDDPWPSV
jgi:hypothetical protein